MPALYQLAGTQVERVHELRQGVTTLGRDWKNDIVLRDPAVSRFHCRITVNGTEALLEDLQATNKTWVAGRPVAYCVRLRPGNRLQVGDHCLIYSEGRVKHDQVAPTASGVLDERSVAPAHAVSSFFRLRFWWNFGSNSVSFGWQTRRK